MTTIKSPLFLKYLLAAYVGDQDFRGIKASGDRWFEQLAEDGLVQLTHQGQWETTEKGKFFIKTILEMPLPETVFVIPIVSKA